MEKAIPVIAVQTLPATSSETNQAAVLTNEETNEKFGLRSPLIVPVTAFLDPELTFSIPVQYTAYACFDIMSHLLEGYFTTTELFAPVQEGFIEGLVSAVKISLERVLSEPEDFDARASIMWAGALAWNGLAAAGLDGAVIPNHMLEHPLSAVYDIPHGAGLSVVMPAWLEFSGDKIAPRIIKFGEKIFGMEGLNAAGEEASAVEAVIAEFRRWIRAAGCPLTMKELGVEHPDITELVKQAKKLSRLWGIEGYSEEDLIEIYNLCV